MTKTALKIALDTSAEDVIRLDEMVDNLLREMRARRMPIVLCGGIVDHINRMCKAAKLRDRSVMWDAVRNHLWSRVRLLQTGSDVFDSQQDGATIDVLVLDADYIEWQKDSMYNLDKWDNEDVPTVLYEDVTKMYWQGVPVSMVAAAEDGDFTPEEREAVNMTSGARFITREYGLTTAIEPRCGSTIPEHHTK